MAQVTIGQKFGMLTALRREESSKNGHAIWYCKCDCGNHLKVFATNLLRDHSTNCGCKRRIKIEGARADVMWSHHKAYRCWKGLQQRCNDPKSDSYVYYGGKGITYDPKWELFEGFWADMGSTWEEGLSLDRIDFNGNYCKDNCRWVTYAVQSQNRSVARMIEFRGETKNLSVWCSELGIDYKTAHTYLDRGKSVEEVFTTKVVPLVEATITYQGVTRTIAEWAKALGLTYNTLKGRLNKGWDVDKACSTPGQPPSKTTKATPALGAVYGCYEIKMIPVTYVNSHSTITVKCIHCGAVKTGVQFNKIKNMYSQCSCQKAVSTTTN